MLGGRILTDELGGRGQKHLVHNIVSFECYFFLYLLLVVYLTIAIQTNVMFLVLIVKTVTFLSLQICFRLDLLSSVPNYYHTLLLFLRYVKHWSNI